MSDKEQKDLVTSLVDSYKKLKRWKDWYRQIGGRKLLTGPSLALKQYFYLQSTKNLQKYYISPAKNLAAELKENTYLGLNRIKDLCTEARRQMGSLLGIDGQHLHACVKLFVYEEGQDGDTSFGSTTTIARSEPRDDRDPMIGRKYSRSVKNSTVSCALLGESDCNDLKWRQYYCFVCNDIQHAKKLGWYCSSRSHCEQYYNSTLVFPLSRILSASNDDMVVYGFLAFDSPLKHAFSNLPDISLYNPDIARLYQSNDIKLSGPQSRSEYHQLLGDSPAYYLGAIFADILSMALEQYYDCLSNHH